MQERKLVRREPYSRASLTKMDAELQSVLDSVPHEGILEQVDQADLGHMFKHDPSVRPQTGPIGYI